MHLDSHKTAFHRWRTWRTSTKAREIWYSVFSLLLKSECYTRVQVADIRLKKDPFLSLESPKYLYFFSRFSFDVDVISENSIFSHCRLKHDV